MFFTRIRVFWAHWSFYGYRWHDCYGLLNFTVVLWGHLHSLTRPDWKVHLHVWIYTHKTSRSFSCLFRAFSELYTVFSSKRCGLGKIFPVSHTENITPLTLLATLILLFLFELSCSLAGHMCRCRCSRCAIILAKKGGFQCVGFSKHLHSGNKIDRQLSLPSYQFPFRCDHWDGIKMKKSYARQWSCDASGDLLLAIFAARRRMLTRSGDGE